MLDLANLTLFFCFLVFFSRFVLYNKSLVIKLIPIIVGVKGKGIKSQIIYNRQRVQ